MKKSTIFYVLIASIGPMIIVALYPITIQLLSYFARNPKDIYIVLLAYYCILQPLCVILLSWILSSKLITKTQGFLWTVSVVFVPIVTAIYFYLFACISSGHMISLSNYMDDYVLILLWLLLWSAVGTMLGYLKYKKTLKKEQALPIKPR